MKLLDTMHRPLRDLRISVTDRCNFRCTYCMPADVFGKDYVFLPHSQILTFEEITRLVRLFTQHGVQKVRITGGEPLVRRDLEKLIAMLRDVPGVDDLTLTTNGSLLKRKARALKEAGLKRITVSLDSLRHDVFKAMNDVDFPVSGVLEGIEAAAEAGLSPIKINMVVQRGVNDADILDMASYFRGTGHILRFIEYMDVGTTNGWRLEQVVSAGEILARIEGTYPLARVPSQYPGEVAERYRYLDGAGEIGIISSVSQPFCGACTRARLSAEGKLYTCLFASSGHDFRALLRSGASDEDLSEFLRSLWNARADRYSEVRTAEMSAAPKVEMSYVGG